MSGHSGRILSKLLASIDGVVALDHKIEPGSI